MDPKSISTEQKPNKQGGWGETCINPHPQGAMELVRKRTAYKSTGTHGSKICPEMLPKGKTKLVCSHVDRQHSSPKLFDKNGRYKKPNNDKNLKVDLDVPSQEKHPINSKMDPILGKQGIGLGVSKFKQLKQVETLSYYISPKERRKSKILSRFDEFLLNEHTIKDGKSSTSHHAVS